MPHKIIFAFVWSSLFFVCTDSLQAQDTSLSVKTHTTDPALGNSRYLKPSALIIPGAFLVYGGLKPVINAIPQLDENIMNDIQEHHANFHSGAEDYIMWAPSASIYIMDAFHVKTQHTFKDHLLIEGGSVLITGGLGLGMRIISRNIKAYNDGDTKFPSGHTANAFRGAEIFHQELKQQHPVISYGGYIVATGVGLLRIYGKQHYLTEVLAGAGLGILSTKITYWLFDKVKKGRK
jgi:membrane-associated phospholipid phosphatase